MTSLLLASDTALLIAAIVGGVVLVALAAVYGGIRRFIRVSWLGWQIPLIFPAVFVVEALSGDISGTLGFVVMVAILFGWSAVVLGGGAIARYAMLARIRPASKGAKVFNVILGSLTSIVNIAVCGVVLAALALSLTEPFAPDLFGAVYQSPLWGKLGKYAFDLVLISFFAVALRAGYRVGFGRALFSTFMIVLTLGTVVLALYFPVGVTFSGRTLAALIGGTMKKVNFIVAFFIGYFISAVLVFAVSFAVVILIGVLLNKLVRKARYNRVVGVVDGVVLAVLFFALAVAFTTLLTFGVSLIADGGLPVTGLGEGLEAILERAVNVFVRLKQGLTSSPVAAYLYRNLPFLSA